MTKREFGKKCVWYHVDGISESNLATLRRKFDLHSAIISELKTPTIRPRVEVIEENIYMVIHFPVYRKKVGSVFPAELDFIIAKNTLITLTYGNMPSISRFVKEFEKGRSDWLTSRTPAHLVYQILRHLVENTLAQLGHVQEDIDHIESLIFNQRAKEVIPKLTSEIRNIINFKQSLAPHDSILQSLKVALKEMFGARISPYFNEIEGMQLKASSEVQNALDIIRLLQQTNDSLLSNHTNEVIKILTLVTVVTLPVTLIATLYGMNVDGLPFLGAFPDPIPLYLILLVMTGLTLLLYIFFRDRKWF